MTDHRALAASLFNAVWDLLDRADRGQSDDDRMIHMAHASRYHWGEVGTAANLVRGEWQCSRVYAVLGRPEPALWHGRRALALCQEHGVRDFDLAFAHEAIARAHAIAGQVDQARESIDRATRVPIAGPDDREQVRKDLATVLS